VSIGTGLRLYIPQLGPVPIAFDFGFPVVSEEDDDTRMFSFSAELPF
jgi:outer membrane protein insertion porin family